MADFYCEICIFTNEKMVGEYNVLKWCCIRKIKYGWANIYDGHIQIDEHFKKTDSLNIWTSNFSKLYYIRNWKTSSQFTACVFLLS